jgi:hypothetical protein
MMTSFLITGFFHVAAPFVGALSPALFAANVVRIGGDKNYNWSWALVFFMVALGLIVTLTPTRRTYEIKKRKDE